MYNNRTIKFRRNEELENLLFSINSDLCSSEDNCISQYRGKDISFPIILIMGPLRSGTTLFVQWLANTEAFFYPTNLLSRFYQVPIIGAKIQLMLTDPRYNFRDELGEFIQQVEYRSENGKTKGVLAPNEFWYFWRRFLPFKDIDYISDKELLEKVDIQTMLAEFAGIIDVFQKPFALKGMILNYNIPFLSKIFDKVVFVQIKREPLANIESVLQARERQLGSIDEWYSFKIPEFYDLIKLPPIEQVAGQIHYINRAVTKGLENVPDENKMTVQYEDFCEDPQKIYLQLATKLELQGCRLNRKYCGEKSFNMTRKQISDRKILEACRKFKANVKD